MDRIEEPMPAPHVIRALARVAATGLVAAITLGALPPVFGADAPTSVLRETRLTFEDLVPARALARPSATGGVSLKETTWTRPSVSCAPIRFTMVGFTWHQDDLEPVPARVSWGRSRTFGPSVRLVADRDEGPDPGSPDDAGIVGTPPLWTGDSECVRVRMRLPEGPRFSDLRAVFINTSGTAGDASPLGWLGSTMARLWGGLASVGAPAPAAATTHRPPIIRRSDWGANESWRDLYCDGEPDYAPRLKMAYVHHTAGSNDYTMAEADDVVRGIYSYHVHSLHYCDIAYNFLIDRFGRIYEGRYGGMTKPVIGGHAMGFNTGSTGVAAMGDFSSKAVPLKVRQAYKRLLAWRLDIAHLPPTGWTWMTSGGGSTTKYDAGDEVHLRVISGHRDTGYTVCPGQRLYGRLPAIREGAERIGTPKIWRPRQTKGQIVAAEDRVRWVARLSEVLDWTVRVENASEVQVRQWTGSGDGLEVAWKGKTAAGVPVPAGDYTVWIEAERPGGEEARSARFTLTVAS
jgi:hypothetical protein